MTELTQALKDLRTSLQGLDRDKLTADEFEALKKLYADLLTLLNQ